MSLASKDVDPGVSQVRAQLVGSRAKGRLVLAADDTIMATGEHMYLHVDTEAGKTVPSVVSSDDRPTVTSSVGWALRTTVNVAVPAASDTPAEPVGTSIDTLPLWPRSVAVAS